MPVGAQWRVHGRVQGRAWTCVLCCTRRERCRSSARVWRQREHTTPASRPSASPAQVGFTDPRTLTSAEIEVGCGPGWLSPATAGAASALSLHLLSCVCLPRRKRLPAPPLRCATASSRGCWATPASTASPTGECRRSLRLQICQIGISWCIQHVRPEQPQLLLARRRRPHTRAPRSRCPPARLFKLPGAIETLCEDYGQACKYKVRRTRAGRRQGHLGHGREAGHGGRLTRSPRCHPASRLHRRAPSLATRTRMCWTTTTPSRLASGTRSAATQVRSRGVLRARTDAQLD